jgi:hypothetical protein
MKGDKGTNDGQIVSEWRESRGGEWEKHAVEEIEDGEWKVQEIWWLKWVTLDNLRKIQKFAWNGEGGRECAEVYIDDGSCLANGRINRHKIVIVYNSEKDLDLIEKFWEYSRWVATLGEKVTTIGSQRDDREAWNSGGME